MNSVRVLKKAASTGSLCLQRNIGICSVLYAKTPTDPIQKLFQEKLKEYTRLSSGGKLVDITPEKQKQYDETLNNLKRQFGADKADYTKFPTFNFPEPKIDPINLDSKA
ncbi:ATP synthase-coupling factor 6, mitochondrial [Parasteatoda tepidariorum]|uniref:Uncharacterized protein n=1 Tax=Parasteatoda tepidariorum TaxID=114398 RepID=A0A2L2Y2X0_PARTP|nr:ATP synthase-coupling factor 6, mitochondrial [Parasteatoda tepidariorum]